MISSQPPVGGVIGAGDTGMGSLFGPPGGGLGGGMDFFSLTTPTTGAYVAPKQVRHTHTRARARTHTHTHICPLILHIHALCI